MTNISTLLEGSVFAADAASESDVANFLANNYPHLTSNDTDAILARYPKLRPLPAHKAWFPTASQAYGEATFICPQTNILNLLLQPQSQLLRRKNRPLFAYRYNVHADENLVAGLGVPHLFDAAAIFGPDNIGGGGGARESYKSYNAPVVPLVMGYYTSFARSLDPNRYRAPGSQEWPSVWEDGGGGEGGGDGAMRRVVFETGGEVRVESVPAEERQRCQFWMDGLGDRLEQR
jgi:carboxylesterase type B